MFRVLPRNDTLDDLWRAGLVYSRNKEHNNPQEWHFDSPEQTDPPTMSTERWEFAIQVEE